VLFLLGEVLKPRTGLAAACFGVKLLSTWLGITGFTTGVMLCISFVFRAGLDDMVMESVTIRPELGVTFLVGVLEALPAAVSGEPLTRPGLGDATRLAVGK